MDLVRRSVGFILLGAVVWLVGVLMANATDASNGLETTVYVVGILIAAGGLIFAGGAVLLLIWALIRPKRA